MAKRKKTGLFGSFDLAKTLGIKKKRKTKASTKIKRTVAKATGVPTTKQGRKNKLKKIFHLK